VTVSRDDIRAAVGAGIVTEAQAARLLALSDSRRGARENLSDGDEPFELFRGFNEIFIVIGLVILAVGAWGAAALFIGATLGNTVPRTVQASALGCAVLWGLSEYFVRRRRMIAPAIALSVMFGVVAGTGLIAAFSHPFMVAQEDFSSLPLPLGLTVVAMGLYWLRFRVPFALAMVATGLFATALVWAAANAGSPAGMTDLFLLSADGPFALITLALGIAVFAAAMAFDMSDPHRVTRRAANGFWLHVVAAPALVNTVALTLLAREDAFGQALLLAFLTLIALVAVVIDRRSFLIAAAGYSVALAAAVFDADGGVWSVLALGAVLLVLGAKWERIRSALLRALPFLPRDRLPPAA
jgi:MFS family permease